MIMFMYTSAPSLIMPCMKSARSEGLVHVHLGPATHNVLMARRVREVMFMCIYYISPAHSVITQHVE